MRNARPILALAVCSASLLAACNSDGRSLREAGPDQTASVYTTTTSSTIAADVVSDGGVDGGVGDLDPALETTALAFVLNLPWEDGGAIDPRYTCDGADIQPGASWLGAPADAAEMAIVVTDSDADNFVHWVIAGLDPLDPFIGENSVPISAIEGTNDFAGESIGWRGPCPPDGEQHHYLFSLYALGEPLELPTGSSATDLQAAIDAVALSVTHRTGVYPGT